VTLRRLAAATCAAAVARCASPVAPRLLATCAAALASFAPAVASAATILVVRSPGAGAVLDEATIRLRAELVAAGFETEAADLASGGDPRVEAEAASVGSRADATLLLLPSSAGADVWLADPATHRTIVQRVAIDLASPQAASVIAVGAVELLRASLVAKTVAPRPPRAPERAEEPPAEPAEAIAPAPAPLLGGARWSAGVATLVGGGGMGPAFGPLLRIAYGTGRLAGRVSVIAPTVEPRVAAAGGTASVLRAVIEAEVVATTAGERATWAPLLALGVGTSYVRVEGNANAGFTGVTADGFFLSATLTAGLALRVSDRSAIVLDAGPSWALPDPSVRIGGADAAHAGSPFLKSSLSVTTSF